MVTVVNTALYTLNLLRGQIVGVFTTKRKRKVGRKEGKMKGRKEKKKMITSEVINMLNILIVVVI